MQVFQHLRMDLARCGCTPIIGAVQGEANTRTLVVTLYDNGVAWEIPEAAVVDVAFKKPDGTQGIYSKLPDGSPATTFDGNVLTAILAPQMLTCAGKVAAAFIFHKDGEKTLATFPFTVTVTANPAEGAERSEDYYNPTIGDIEAEVKAILASVSVEAERVAKEITESLTAADVGAVPSKGFIDWFAKGTAIPSGADLNTYKTDGKYYGQSIVSTLTNCPTEWNFVLFVSTRTYVDQKIQILIDLKGQLFVRGATASEWNAWKKYSTSEELSSHTGDTNNPHNVTADQVGARPDTWTPTAAEVGARPNTWTPTAEDVGAVSTDGFIDWFGVPETIPANADISTYITPGKYYCTEANSKTLTNSPIGNDAFILYVTQRSSKSVAQLAFGYAGNIYYRMATTSGTFNKEWAMFTRKTQVLLATESTNYPGCFYRTVDDVTEWYNPPLIAGKEYRTTERSEGKIVYAKRVAYTFTADIGDGSSNIDYSVPHGISGFVRLVRIFATDGVSYPLPYYTSGGGHVVFKSVDSGDIHLRAYKAVLSARTLYFDVYYTKE